MIDELQVSNIALIREATLVPSAGLTVLTGETGAGKSTTAFGIMRILPDPPAKITGGEILYKGRDLLKLSAKEMRASRRGCLTARTTRKASPFSAAFLPRAAAA